MIYPRVAILAVALIVAFVSGWFAHADRAERAANVAAAKQRIVVAAMQVQTNLEAVAHEQERQAIEDRADAADIALDRLRKAVVARDRDPGATCRSDGVAVKREVLGDCATEYRRVAEEADRLRARLVTLQAWARIVAP